MTVFGIDAGNPIREGAEAKLKRLSYRLPPYRVSEALKIIARLAALSA